MIKRKISEMALNNLQRLEGCRLRAYRDIKGVLTIGYGHTSSAGEPIVYEDSHITLQEAKNILLNDITKFEEVVNRYTKVPLTDNQFDCLVLFCYNVGAENFRRSNLLRKLNKGLYKAVPEELLKWVYSGKTISQGLINRRIAESKIWNKNASDYTNYSLRDEKVSNGTLQNKLKKFVAIAAPLSGIASAGAELLARAPILQIALACLVLPSTFFAIFYYFKYVDRIEK